MLSNSAITSGSSLSPDRNDSRVSKAYSHLKRLESSLPAIVKSPTSSSLFVAIKYRILSGQKGRRQRAITGPTSSPCFVLVLLYTTGILNITISPPLHAQSDVLSHIPKYRIAPMVPVIGSDPSMPWVIRARVLGGASSINQEGPPEPTTMKDEPNRNLPTRSWITKYHTMLVFTCYGLAAFVCVNQIVD